MIDNQNSGTESSDLNYSVCWNIDASRTLR